MVDGSTLFNGRSAEYARFRPSYPVEILEVLRRDYSFSTNSVVADIGCGTGKLSRLFLENGDRVICIDPGKEMLDAARAELSGFGKADFRHRYAEDTGIADNSVDLVTAGQSFHWFDPNKAGNEFRRILKGNGIVVLVWNDRNDSEEGFMGEYERICRKYSRKYHKSGSKSLDESGIRSFFGSKPRLYEFTNAQQLDFTGVLGRYASASYAIAREDKNYEKMASEFRAAFDQYEDEGKVTLDYVTRMYAGSL